MDDEVHKAVILIGRSLTTLPGSTVLEDVNAPYSVGIFAVIIALIYCTSQITTLIRALIVYSRSKRIVPGGHSPSSNGHPILVFKRPLGVQFLLAPIHVAFHVPTAQDTVVVIVDGARPQLSGLIAVERL